jgi:polyphenol oxidase
LHPDWLIPDWPAPAEVKAVFTTRAGGVSAGNWDSMNLGDHVGDLPAHVAANRQLLRQASGTHIAFLQQVHGTGVASLTAAAADGVQADAAVATAPGVACCMMVADCLPVLLCTTDGRVVAAAHAGWRGLAGMDGAGVLEAVLKQIRAAAQAEIAPTAIKIIAWLGPCIGPDAFEVGSEVKAAFASTHAAAAAFFRPLGGGKFMADLPALARLRLEALGVDAIYGNDGSAGWCTVSNPSRFFSHRRDASLAGAGGNGFGTTGRMAACVWRD